MESIRQGRRDLWLPGLIAAACCTLTLAGWGTLVSERRQKVMDSALEHAEETGRLAARGVSSYVVALSEHARLWTLIGRHPADRWNEDVTALILNLPALDSVAWVDAHGRASLVSPGSNPEDLPDEALVRRVMDSGPSLIGPGQNSMGETSMRILYPVSGGDEGALVSRLDLRELLDETLEGVSPGYALKLRWGSKEIFSRGDPAAGLDWWRVERTVKLPYGMTWSLALRPTEDLADALLTPTPSYLLVAGLALSLLLAVLAHQLRTTVRQARYLSAANRALEDHGDELERRVAERTRDLEEAVSQLKEFNQTVSHDLRSPIGAVLNFTTILEEDYRGRPLDRQGLEILARIRRSATRATQLLEGLQHLSRASRSALIVTSVDMHALVKEVFGQVCAEQDDRDVELAVERLPVVAGDRALLGTVLSNLFTNAFKYSRGLDGRRVRVSATPNGRQCVFEVADNGRGFDMRFNDKLFGMFERLDPQDGVEGTGVGLAIVERIVTRHAGRVWAESEPGEGARFYFTLPLAREEPS